MNINISLNSVINSLKWFLRRFHVVIFVVIVFGGLAVAVLILSGIVQSSTDTTDQTAATLNTSFDQETIKRIENLRTRDDSAGSIDLPPGRINPFVE